MRGGPTWLGIELVFVIALASMPTMAAGCSKSDSGAAGAGSAAGSLAAKTVSYPLPSMALVRDGHVAACTDATLAISLPAGSSREQFDQVFDGFKSAPNPYKDWSAIPKACLEQFHDAIATCTGPDSPLSNDAGVTFSGQHVTRYYDLDMITKSDREKRACLDLKGDWQAVDPSSEAYRNAELARAQRLRDAPPERTGR